MTGKQMCEHIVKTGVLKHKDGTPVNPKEVWEYSKTGELDMIPVWFAEVCLRLPFQDK